MSRVDRTLDWIDQQRLFKWLLLILPGGVVYGVVDAIVHGTSDLSLSYRLEIAVPAGLFVILIGFAFLASRPKPLKALPDLSIVLEQGTPWLVRTGDPQNPNLGATLPLVMTGAMCRFFVTNNAARSYRILYSRLPGVPLTGTAAMFDGSLLLSDPVSYSQYAPQLGEIAPGETEVVLCTFFNGAETIAAGDSYEGALELIDQDGAAHSTILKFVRPPWITS